MKEYSDFLSAIKDLENSLAKREYIREAYFSLPIKSHEYNIRPPAREAELDRAEMIDKIDEQVIPLFQKDAGSRKASVILTYADTGLGRCMSSSVFWIEGGKLHCTAFFRSMCLILFPYDYETISLVASHIIDKMGFESGEAHFFIVNLYNKPIPGIKETSWREFVE